MAACSKISWIEATSVLTIHSVGETCFIRVYYIVDILREGPRPVFILPDPSTTMRPAQS